MVGSVQTSRFLCVHISDSLGKNIIGPKQCFKEETVILTKFATIVKCLAAQCLDGQEYTILIVNSLLCKCT